MRSNAYLAKRLDELEALSDGKTSELAERIKQLEDSSTSSLNNLAGKLVEKIKLKLFESDPNLTAMHARLTDLVSSLSMMETLVEEVKAINAGLVVANKTLQTQNETLANKLSEV